MPDSKSKAQKTHAPRMERVLFNFPIGSIDLTKNDGIWTSITLKAIDIRVEYDTNGFSRENYQ